MALNKDRLEPGALVDDETHARLMRKHQREAAKPKPRVKKRKPAPEPVEPDDV